MRDIRTGIIHKIFCLTSDWSNWRISRSFPLPFSFARLSTQIAQLSCSLLSYILIDFSQPGPIRLCRLSRRCSVYFRKIIVKYFHAKWSESSSAMQRVSRVSYPRPRVTKLGPHDRVDWVIVPKPVLTTSINDTTFRTFQNIPEKVTEL